MKKALFIAAAAAFMIISAQTVRADELAQTTPVPAQTTPVPTPAPAQTTPAPAPTPQPLKTVDLVIFAGQSNMSGRGGDAKAAPGVPVDTGYEFRYGTCPTGMYPITEPFGIYSNGYLCDLPALRGGSLVSAFANTYYRATGVPVLGFSAARGGSSIGYWQSKEVQAELISKYDTIKAWCAANHVSIRKSYVVWLQGETDGVGNISMQGYKVGLSNVFTNLFVKGLDQVFVITIGQYAGLPGTYDKVAAAQIELCAQDPRFTLGSDALRTLPAAYLTDGCHYNQAALNIVGSQCASAAAARTKMGN
ncbi:MAG: sialate O-acetylesterase [Lachnospiraceae bacterium]|nr:sialate O-acetylesterase [Lachnospiraceae bacterium]